MLSEVAYSGQLAMICRLDAEWSRQRFDEYRTPYDSVQNQIGHICAEYRKRICDNFASFLEANQTKSIYLSHAKLASSLYRPVYYIPFGHSDVLAIVLVDTFDALSHITTKLQTTVEGIDFGFCPSLGNFGESADASPLVNLGELLSHTQDPDASDGVAARRHPFQHDLPLLVQTKLKIDWWGTVGSSMLFEQFLLKAVHSRVRGTLRKLAGLCDKDEHDSLYERDDVTSLRYAVVDLQGEEELSILFFCRNYTVAVSVIASLRCLSLKDVLAEDKDGVLEKAIVGDDTYRAVWDLYRSLPKNNRERNRATEEFSLGLVEGNHVFRWTKSLPAVAPFALFEENPKNCHGQLGAAAHFRIAPGHDWEAYQSIASSPNVPGNPDGNNEDRRLLYSLGVDEFEVEYGESQTEREESPLMSLVAALNVIRTNLATFGCCSKKYSKPPSGPYGRIVIDTATHFRIPVPTLEVFQAEPNGQEPLLLSILPEIQKELFYPEEGSSACATEASETRSGQMDLATLALTTSKCGVPAELRRTILVLYRDFAAFLADPFLFDSVLDLYDSFATFYETITKHIPEDRARELLRSADEWLTPLDSDRVSIITQIVQGLHNALTCRVRHMYPESPIRRNSIDVRVGLTQVLLASTAPLTCGLGLLRKYVISVGPNASSRRSVGGLTSVTLDPGTRACWFNLEINKPVQLALIEVDIPHVLHPASYADYLHECAHLIYRSFASQRITGLKLASISDPHMSDRVQELFANLVTHLVLFAGDSRVFAYHHVLSFARQHCVRSTDDKEIIVPFSELLIRLFLVADCVVPDTPRSSWLGKPWRRANTRTTDVFQAFQQFLNDISPFLPKYDVLWRDETSRGRRFCEAQFRTLYPKIRLYMPSIWSHAVYVLEAFYRHDLNGSTDNDPQVGLYPVVCKALREGRPLIRCLYRADLTDASEPPSEKELDSLALGCATLYQYISRVREAEGKHIYLELDGQRGRVVYADGGKPWYDFQVEVGVASMYCPIPQERSNRLKREIAMLKTFWDIAANLRARRLHEMTTIAMDGKRNEHKKA